MPSWKEHTKFCLEYGIDKEICDFANRLVDMPEEYILKFLKNPKVREYLSNRLNLNSEEIDAIVIETEIVYKIKKGKICEDCNFREGCKFKDLEVKPKPPFDFTNNIKFYFREDYMGRLEIVFVESREKKFFDDLTKMKSESREIDLKDYAEYWKNCPICRKDRNKYPNAIEHSKVHTYSDSNRYLEIIKGIARYYYGEKGVEAVELHLELDELSHILNAIKSRIPSFLARGVRGKVYEQSKEYTIVNIIRRYIYRDPIYLVRTIDLTNYRTFLNNIIQLLSMTVGEFLAEYKLNYNGFMKNRKIIEILTENEENFGQFVKFLKKNVEVLEKIADEETKKLLHLLK